MRLARSHAAQLVWALAAAACSCALLRATAEPHVVRTGPQVNAWFARAIAPSPPPSRAAVSKRHGWLAKEAGRAPGLIYVADDSQVVVFPKNGTNPQPIGAITDGVDSAYGLHVDAQRNLFVVNQSGSVRVYTAGALTPAMSYFLGLHRPLYCTTAHDGTLYIGDADGGDIVVYARGVLVPERILHTPGVEADGLTVDGRGNLFVAYRDYTGNGSVDVFPGGKGNGIVLGMPLTQPQGLLVDGSGDIVVVETGGTDTVDIFPPGALIPSRRIAVPDIPTQIAFGDERRRLYISDLDNIVYAMRYPRGTPRSKIENGLYSGVVQGLSVSPPAKP